MPNPEVVTNYNDSDGVDLGKKLISKDYLISVYPQIADQLITPELWTWGLNQFGGAGDNTNNNNRYTPVTTLAGGSNWKQVSASIGCAAIKTDGTLWTWGYNAYGNLGINDTTDRSTPVTTFAGGTNWKQVSSGARHTAAIKTDGTLWTWGGGVDIHGALGTNDNTNRYTPVTTFAGGTNWKQVYVFNVFTVAIKTDGTLWTWGYNLYGQLGTNDTTDRSTPVTTFAGGTNWKQVSSGYSHTAAIKTDGTLWTWGLNNYGQLGINDTTDRSTPVTTFAGGTNWKQVSFGNENTEAIKTDGTLWTWGYNYNNASLGINASGNRTTPVTTFAGGTNWKQVGAGRFASTAIKTDGTLWTWGINTYGNLGINDSTDRATPVTTLAGGTNWKQVSGGGYITAAIKTSDDLIGI